MSDRLFTWTQAVEWLRRQPEKQELVKACYYDDPIEEAALRFYHSQEWQEVFHILHDYIPCNVLDLGAGRGISSYAFSREGCTVTALEPDASPLVGSAAIKTLSERTSLVIQTVRAHGESLPFKENSFDIVYGRAVLHHTHNLNSLCHNAARVLKPGGIFIATREHVISRLQDLEIFLRSHPLHFLYCGEHAFLLKEYKKAIKSSGLKLKNVIGPYESVINYAPTSQQQFKNDIASLLTPYFGSRISKFLLNIPTILSIMGLYLSLRSTIPGRLYSFVAVKQ